jgi:hypothetical protein
MLDLLRFAVAILPLAAYTNVLGLLRLRSRPTVLSGAMDLLLLGLAVIGIIAIGPIELFFPRAAYSLLGIWVWIVLIALYLFILMLLALNSPPKLVVYGLDYEALRVQFCELLEEERIRAQWLGDLVELPELGVRASIEPAGRGGVSQIHSAGGQQNLTGWFTLERLLVNKVSSARIHQYAQGITLVCVSLLLFGIAGLLISNDLPRLQQAMVALFEGS